jgi:hypothetical protein
MDLADTVSDMVTQLERASWKKRGVLDVPRTTAISPMTAVSASPMYESVRVNVYKIEMHTTSAISALTAGSVAN